MYLDADDVGVVLYNRRRPTAMRRDTIMRSIAVRAQPSELLASIFFWLSCLKYRQSVTTSRSNCSSPSSSSTHSVAVLAFKPPEWRAPRELDALLAFAFLAPFALRWPALLRREEGEAGYA